MSGGIHELEFLVFSNFLFHIYRRNNSLVVMLRNGLSFAAKSLALAA